MMCRKMVTMVIGDEESVVRFEIYLFPKDTGDISMHI